MSSDSDSDSDSDNDSDNDEIVMYLVVRTDLHMSKGKIAGQVGHAVQLAMRAAEETSAFIDEGFLSRNAPAYRLREWESKSYPKIVCRVESEAELESLAKVLWENKILFVSVIDEGRTEIPPGTVTSIGIAPAPKNILRSYVGHLKLL